MSNGSPSACPCGPPGDPLVVSNPPGLSQVSCRAGDFTGFRRALLRPLPGEQAIGAWQPAPGDLGLQVLEWWAYLGDVLTFYNQLIANESYLRTATQPGSIADLVALLGYQPAPGIAATGNVAVVRSPANPDEPLVIPQGMRISSKAAPGVGSQSFEVSGQASFTGPSSVPVSLTPDTALAVNTDGTPASVLLAGKVTGISPGDQLVLAGNGFAGTDDNWSLVTVGSLAPATAPGTGAVNTLVTFSAGGWGPTPTPSQPPAGLFVSGTQSAAGADLAVTESRAVASPGPRAAATFSVSGRGILDEGVISYHWVPRMPAPPGPRSSPQSTSYQLLRPTAAAALWNQGATGNGQTVISQPEGGGLTVHLSAAVRLISPGDMVLFDCGAGSPSALATVAGVAEEFWAVPYPGSPQPTPPDIAVAHTVLTLTLATLDSWALLDLTDTAQQAVTVRYAFKPVGTITGVPAPALPALPATVGVPASYTPQPGAIAFLQDTTGAGILVTVNAAGQGQVTLTPSGTPPPTLAAPLLAPIQLLPDVVPVSRGTTVTGEVLGSGNAALTNQSFTLAKSPLTYLASGDSAVPVLTVYVGGTQWQQVPSFYGQAPNAQVFTVSRSPDQTVTTVTFGDGVNGARLTSGTGNVTATYRYGSGAASPPAGRLTTISQPQPNLASIQNPVAVSGGAGPQAPGDVRTSAPASVFTFGRAVSALDYEVIAAQAPGVSRVAATWTFDGSRQRTAVTVYVGDDQAAAAAASAALAGADDPNRPVSVVAATPVELTLSCTLVVAAGQRVPAVTAAAAAAVSNSPGGLFSPARMGIGQRLYRSAVEAALLVPGVVAVHDLLVIQPEAGLFGELFEVLAEVFDPGAFMVFDPGEGSFFDLPPANTSILGVSAG